MKKGLIFVSVFFSVLISLNFVSAITINQFNNSLTEENLTFTGDENITRYLSINKNANVTSAFLNLSVYNSGICYQEFVNTSTVCGGLNTGFSYDFGLGDGTWDDGNWSTRDFFTDGNRIFINYTKPEGALNSSLWKGKSGTNGQFFSNMTIPSSCWNYDSNNLVFRYYIGLSQYFQCFNGTWVTTGGTGSGYGYIWEEALWWDYGNITDPYLEIGIPDGIYEWNYFGGFNETFSPNQTNNLSSAINTALDNGNCTGGILSGDNCLIPFLFHSDTVGTLNYFNINVNAPVINIFENVKIINNLNVNQNITGLKGFFDYLGSSISRIVKGWFTEIDSINITTQSITVNNTNVCLEDGTNCPSEIEIKSGSIFVVENLCTSISFNTAFLTTPVVVGTVENGADNNVVSIDSLSTSGFDLCLNKVRSGGGNYTVYWTATNAGNS